MHENRACDEHTYDYSHEGVDGNFRKSESFQYENKNYGKKLSKIKEAHECRFVSQM